MGPHHYLPDKNRLSVIIATILLAYALTRFVDIPTISLSLGVLGVLLSFQLNFHTVVSALVAVMAATGSEWILRDHPGAANSPQTWRTMLHHWLLPALTAWVMGVPLNSSAGGLSWWIILGAGGTLLVLVYIAEYNVVDAADVYHPVATLGLTALSFALYLFLAIALWSAGLRLYLLLPALVLAAGLVCLRTLYLRTGGRWLFAWSAGIALVVGQFATGLHYWPISPVRFGLLILGPTYVLTSLAGSVEEGRSTRSMVLEPVVMLTIVWGLGIWLAK